MGSHFGVGDFTTHFGTYLSGDWDVYWGYDLDFDPWPSVFGSKLISYQSCGRTDVDGCSCSIKPTVSPPLGLMSLGRANVS